MTNRSRRRSLARAIGVVILGCAGVVAIVAVGIGAVAEMQKSGDVWDSTETKLAYRGRVYDDRVATRQGLYLVTLPTLRGDEGLLIRPKEGTVEWVDAPGRVWGQIRTNGRGGLLLTGGGKSDTRAEVRRIESGIRVRLSPSLGTDQGGTSDEFELRFRTPATAFSGRQP